jgi:hypothetical protein
VVVSSTIRPQSEPSDAIFQASVDNINVIGSVSDVPHTIGKSTGSGYNAGLVDESNNNSRSSLILYMYTFFESVQ